MARSCDECGVRIPWGAPQCVGCGAYTHWRSRLATFGISIGTVGVTAVIASIAWVSLRQPPEALQRSAEVQAFLSELADSGDRELVGGAGRCKAEIADALCVQLTARADELGKAERKAGLARIRAQWQEHAEIHSSAIVFIGRDGRPLAQD